MLCRSRFGDLRFAVQRLSQCGDGGHMEGGKTPNADGRGRI